MRDLRMRVLRLRVLRLQFCGLRRFVLRFSVCKGSVWCGAVRRDDAGAGPDALRCVASAACLVLSCVTCRVM